MPEKTFINKLKNKETELLFKVLLKHGEVRFIGGCIRDALLGIDFSDIDLATNLLPERVIELLSAAGVKVIPTGLKHGTVTAIFGLQQFQITTLRKDIDCDGRHASIVFTDSWQEDAARRDFTINALSATIEGELFDYFGGLADLKAQKVRFIGDALDRIQEDYLRILRFYRFSAKYGNGSFDSEICRICSECREKIKLLSEERIYSELEKVTALPLFYQVFSQLNQDKILTVLLPNVKLNLSFLESLMHVSEKLRQSPTITLVLAALQIDSKYTDTSLLKKNTELRLFEAIRDFNFDEYADIEKKIRKFHYITGEQFKSFFMILFAINYKAVYHQLWIDLFSIYSRKDRNIFPINGADLLALGYKSGMLIGQKLRQLEDIWIESDFKLGKEELLKNHEVSSDAI